MATRLLSFIAVLIAIASSVTATPVKRADSAYVLNGDFSQPLEGTWNVSSSGDNTAGGSVSEVRVQGNPAVQFYTPGSCGNGARPRFMLTGTIVDLEPGSRYKITFDFRLSEHWDNANWRYAGYVSVYRGANGLRGLDQTHVVKKNQYYSFSGLFHIKDRAALGHPGNATFHLTYDKCGLWRGFPGYVTVDNIGISYVGPWPPF